MNKTEIDQKYLKILDGIRAKVRYFYSISNRNDLIMLYEVDEEKIYSYIYSEFLLGLNERSQKLLEMQFGDAQKSNGIVVFIRDEENEIFKSYIV